MGLRGTEVKGASGFKLGNIKLVHFVDRPFGGRRIQDEGFDELLSQDVRFISGYDSCVGREHLFEQGGSGAGMAGEDGDGSRGRKRRGLLMPAAEGGGVQFAREFFAALRAALPLF